ncbi:hypothetical protein Tco_0932487 [Tanacetum coccineum]
MAIIVLWLNYSDSTTVGLREMPIVGARITADNIELKQAGYALTLVQNKQFFGHDKEDASYKAKVRNSRNKPVVAKVSSSSSTPGISSDVAELKDMVKALLLDKKNQSPAPTPVKAVKENCVTYGGAHSYRNCPATNGNVIRDNRQSRLSAAVA